MLGVLLLFLLLLAWAWAAAGRAAACGGLLPPPHHARVHAHTRRQQLLCMPPTAPLDPGMHASVYWRL